MQPIQYQTDLTPYNTFGLRAQAQAFIALEHADELRDIVRLPEFDRDTVLWLGSGSNILLMQDYAGLVVHMENKGIREIARSDGLVYIEAQAGEIWHDFVLHTVALGLNGLEKPEPDSGYGRRVARAEHRCIRRGSERCDSQRALLRFGYGNLCRACQCRLPLRLPRKPVQAGRQRALCDCFGRIRPERAFRAEFGLRRFGGRRCRTERGQGADGERRFRCSVCNPQQ